jgi:hypothetical protein
MKINNNRFLKYISNTLKDLEIQKSESDLVSDLKNILQTKELTALNISNLVYFLNTRDYKKELSAGCLVGTYDKALKATKAIQKEHKFLKKVLSQYFDIEINEHAIQIAKR